MPFDIELGPKTKTIFSAPRCGICLLYKKCKSPKMPVRGNGKKGILIVGEGPGATEDEQNKPFVGSSGKLLEECLEEVGIRMWKDCWITNAIICRPLDNRTPTSEEISYCQPNLAKAIKTLQPTTILTVGRAAIESLMTGIWLEDIGPMGRWAGWKIPGINYNAWVVPTYHPSFILREMEMGARRGTPIKKIFLDHLKLITEEKRPYETPPDYEKQIEVLTEQEFIVRRLKQFREWGGPIAFDYETMFLKPDRGGKIFSASVCWNGEKTIAFPWYGKEVKKEWKNLLESDCPKIAFNLKFEDRWSHANGIAVKNWTEDPMILAHIYDNRKYSCSLGFQALIWLGQGTYGMDSSYLAEKDSYKTNRIAMANLKQVLNYNGMDALLTYLVNAQLRGKLRLPKL